MNDPFKNIRINIDKDNTNGGDPFDQALERVIKNGLSDDVVPISSVVGYGLGIGDSKYDEGLLYDAIIQNEDITPEEFVQEYRAQRQPSIVKLGALLPRVVNKAAAEVLKMPGVIAGIVSAPFAEKGKRWDVAFNNQWVKAIDQISENVNKDLLPVYVRRAVEDGNILDKISSADFYATEGADGLGYFISFLVPGAAISKASLGTKMMKGLKTLGNMTGKVDDATQALAKLGLTPNKIDTSMAALGNTIFEAGSEAKGASDSFQMKLDAKLANGEITQEEYDRKLERKADIMMNTFLANAGILIGPNMIMSKMLWGKSRNKAVGKLFTPRGEIIDAVGKRSVLKKLSSIGTDIGRGSLREGFFEEGTQSTAENYFVEKALEDQNVNIFDFIGDLPQAYLETLKTTDGQTAIFLGSMLGGGAQAVIEGIQRGKDIKKAKLLLPELQNLDNFYKSFADDVYEVDEDGNTKINYSQVADKLRSFSNLEKISNIYDEAIQTGNESLVEDLRMLATGDLIKPFVMSDELGIDALQQYFDVSKTFTDIAQKEQKDIDNIINPILKRAEKMQRDYNVFSQFAPSILSLDNPNATKQDKQAYYDKMSSLYLSNKNVRYYVEDRLNKAKGDRSNVLTSLGLPSELVTEDEVLIRQAKDNFALKEINDIVKKLEEELDTRKEIDNAFWNLSEHKTAFDNYIDKKVELEAGLEAKKQKEIEDKLAKIKSAQSEEDLNSIFPNTKTPADKLLRDAIKNKRKELKQLEKEETERQVENQVKKSSDVEETAEAEEETKTDIGNYLVNNYNVGESFALGPELIQAGSLDPSYLDSEGIIQNENDITDDTVVVYVVEAGQSIAIPRNPVKTDKFNSEDTYQTEGSEYHDELRDSNNENEIDDSDAVSKTGSKIISTNKETGEPFSFVSKAYIEYEREPINKIGKEIRFEINFNATSEINWKKAIDMYKANDYSNQEFLIDHLPINARVSDDISSPIETLPRTDGAKKIFNNSSRLLRTSIINALASGNTINDITTTIEGQYPGTLTINNKLANNSIFDLYHFKGMSESEKIDYFKNNIAIVKENGDFEFLNGDTLPFINRKGELKTNGKGELYLMTPMANGKKFPLKLNISHISSEHAELLHQLYKIRIEDKTINKSTTLNELGNVELKNRIKEDLSEEIKLIGIPLKDITVKDITDFIIWDGTKSIKSQVRFKGTGKKGESVFIYGNPKLTGKEVTNANELTDDFNTWLTNNKRYNINFKPKKNQSSKAAIKINDNYIKYLLDNNILSTNAVVNEPTFQGYSNIYLDSQNVKVKGQQQIQTDIAAETTNADISPYNKDKDGTNLFSSSVSKVTYFASSKSGRVFKGQNLPGRNQGIPSIEKLAGEVVVDNDIISSVESDIKSDFFGDPNIQLKRYDNTLNSQKNFVSSHEVKNTPENKEVEKLKEEVKKKDSLPKEITKEQVSELFKRLMGKKLVKIGSQSKKLLSGSNKENFERLKEIAEKNQVAIDDIITKCK